MSFDKDFFRPLGIIAFAVLILMAISEWIPDYENEYIRIRAIHFITGKDAPPVEYAMTPGSSLQDQIAAEAISATKKDNYYSRSARKSSARKGSTHKEKNYIQEPVAPPPPLVYDSNPLASLRPFFEKLNQNISQGRPVRIAFYGDSIIEGDLITEELRKQLQDRFGGQGVGMVPITSIVAGFRVTIRHSFSGQWNTYSLMNRPPQNIPLGISGFVYQVAGNGSHKVRYQATRNFNKTDKFSRITLYYSHAPEGGYVEYSLDGQPDMVAELKPGESVQSVVLNETTPVKTIDIKFMNCPSAYIYGVNFDDRSGVYVDNYSMRGYSGMLFRLIPLDIMEDFQQYLNYDLIILQYGANVSNPNCKNYDFYKRGMVNSINHIKKTFPNSPILVVSTADKGARINGRYQTSPDIPALVRTQYEIARETNSGFWNLYEAMGGYNSIVNFVNAKPPMANHDYTHFTYHGTNKVADLLTGTFMGEYDKYRSNRSSGRLSDARY